jgi:hypothetical protein
MPVRMSDISVPRALDNQGMQLSVQSLPFLRTKPSCTGVTEVVLAPMSITRALGFPEANLREGQRSVLWHTETDGLTLPEHQSCLTRKQEHPSLREQSPYTLRGVSQGSKQALT